MTLQFFDSELDARVEINHQGVAVSALLGSGAYVGNFYDLAGGLNYVFRQQKSSRKFGVVSRRPHSNREAFAAAVIGRAERDPNLKWFFDRNEVFASLVAWLAGI